jgi:hypothetical protein
MLLVEDQKGRQDMGIALNDGVGFERENFPDLKTHHINASTVEEADYSHFLQPYKNILPLALRSFSVDSSYQNSGSLNHEFQIPHHGTYMYGFKPQLFIDGIVAMKEQNVSHGNNKTAQGYASYGDNEVSQVTLLSGDTTNVAEWVSHATHTQKLNSGHGKLGATPTKYKVWNESLNPPAFDAPVDVQSDGTLKTGGSGGLELKSGTWYYVHAVSKEAGDTNDVATSTNPLTLHIVPATAYSYSVAEGKHQEPYYYAPGYTLAKELVIEALQSDVLYHTAGEYSYFLNQLFREWDHHKEDEKLAKVFTDDRFKLFTDDSTHEKKFITSREYAQRKARSVDTVYSPFRHPFQSPQNSIPVSQVFSSNIRFKMNMLNQSKAVVMPANDQFSKSHLKQRPIDKSRAEHFSNEDLRRGKKDISKLGDLEDQKPQARLELVIADVHPEEEQVLNSSSVPNVCRQPQVWHFDVPSSKGNVSSPDPATGLPNLSTNQSPQLNLEHSFTPDGFASEIVVYARQQKRINAGKIFDLRAYQDPVTQRWQSALFSASLNYEGHCRSISRNDNKGTSENVHSTFYENMPNLGCDATLHVIPFALKPASDTEYSGVASLSNQRQSVLHTSINRNAFFYVDEQGKTQLTDIVVTAIVNTDQVFHFGVGSVIRNFQYHDTPPRVPA